MCFFFVFKHKTALEVRISDWSSDVCSSDLIHFGEGNVIEYPGRTDWNAVLQVQKKAFERERLADAHAMLFIPEVNHENATGLVQQLIQGSCPRSEEHTSELQSLMRISYAVFCWKKKNTNI